MNINVDLILIKIALLLLFFIMTANNIIFALHFYFTGTIIGASLEQSVDIILVRFIVNKRVKLVRAIQSIGSDYKKI